MDQSFGRGQYIEGTKRLEGEIVLSRYKLFCKGEAGDFPQTYIPLEKIASMKLKRGMIELFVRPSAVIHYTAVFKGEPANCKKLSLTLAMRLNMRKKFFRDQWTGEVSWK